MPQEFQIASLALIKDEIFRTLKNIENSLGEWLVDDTNDEALGSAIKFLGQLSGTAKIISLEGLAQFYELASKVLESEKFQNKPGDSHQNFAVVLIKSEKYVQYLLDGGLSASEVLHPDMVKLARMAGLKSPNIAQFCPNTLQAVELKEYKCSLAELKRFRTMYQTGLIALIKGENNRAGLLMERAATRLKNVSEDADALLWNMAEILIRSVENDATLPKIAKQQFSFLDRYLAARVNTRLDIEKYNEALASMCWLAAVSRASGHALETPPYNETADFSWSELESATTRMAGVSSDTLDSVAQLVLEELRQARELVEQMHATSDDNAVVDQLVNKLKTISQTLNLITLTSVATLVDSAIKSLLEASVTNSIDQEVAESLAENLIYIDSCMHTLGSKEVGLEAFDAKSRSESVTDNLLNSAKSLALGEAKSKVAEIKHAMTRFVENGFDPQTIDIALPNLQMISGVLFSLNLERPRLIVKSAEAFVSEKLIVDQVEGGIEPMLETFADALVGLEYYIDQLQHNEAADTSVLDLAAESLSAVGY